MRACSAEFISAARVTMPRLWASGSRATFYRTRFNVFMARRLWQLTNGGWQGFAPWGEVSPLTVTAEALG